MNSHFPIILKGEKGVLAVLEILRKELDLAFALSGCATTDDAHNLSVVHQNWYYPKL